MTPIEFREQLETELQWRQEEIAFFKNQLNEIHREQDKDRYRKSLVLILYSHFEGYIKIAFQIYIQYINSCDLKRKDVNAELQASSMNHEFNAYDNLDRKSNFFRRPLPDDTSLHRFYRRCDLISSFDNFANMSLELSDQIVDTESNLWYVVLQKNLYKLGLPLDLFEPYKGDIDALVNRRNSIAHGTFRNGVTETEFQKWEEKVQNIFRHIPILLYDYTNNQRYLLNHN